VLQNYRKASKKPNETSIYLPALIFYLPALVKGEKGPRQENFKIFRHFFRSLAFFH
jgi:hypothetical protein